MTNTLFVGKVYLRFDELPSTNDYARELLAKSKPAEGTVVRAASQSAGRGQFGSHWLSAPGENLTLSVILYPTWVPAAAQFRLSQAIALAVRDTVAQALGPGVATEAIALKWPNDVYIGARKTAGILIQNTVGGAVLQASVVGIGLNVNQMIFPAGAPNATSLALAAGRLFDLDTVAEVLFSHLEQRYLQLKAGHTEALHQAYLAHLLGLGETRQFERPDGNSFEGVITGVAEDGRLRVRTKHGEEVFALKELIFRFSK